MIVVEAWMTCRADAVEEFAVAAKRLVQATETEPDFKAYRCARDLTVSERFVFIEQWADQEALARHASTPHYRAFAEQAKGWVTERKIRIHEVAETTER